MRFLPSSEGFLLQHNYAVFSLYLVNEVHVEQKAMYRFLKTIILLLFFSFQLPGLAQVANDHIENRLSLTVDSASYLSNTTNCTVQQACVDESLTGKCIQYHNDQWFEFTTGASGTYFMNIAGQQCRDTRGVQLVVIDGTPCQTETYQVLSCTSLATQDDIFVPLPALKANHTYLLNVDGYLHDFCQFVIQVSTQAKGLPVQIAQLSVHPTVQLDDNRVNLSWVLPEELGGEIGGYQIWRRHEKENRFILIRTVPHEQNARGESQMTYALSDVIQEKGNYSYKIIATRTTHEPILLTEQVVTYTSVQPGVFSPDDMITLALKYRKDTPLTLLIYDTLNEKLLKQVDFAYSKKTNEIRYYVGNLKKQGIYLYTIVVIDQSTKLRKEYRFTMQPQAKPAG